MGSQVIAMYATVIGNTNDNPVWMTLQEENDPTNPQGVVAAARTVDSIAGVAMGCMYTCPIGQSFKFKINTEEGYDICDGKGIAAAITAPGQLGAEDIGGNPVYGAISVETFEVLDTDAPIDFVLYVRK